jgi:hypothetical protein
VAIVEAITGIATALEHSGLGEAARSAGFLYPLANMLHVLGAALLVGSIATLDVQVIRGAASTHTIYGAVILVAVTGFVLEIGSGVVLLSADAVAMVHNPAFLFKMAMLVLALANAALFHRQFGRATEVGAGFPVDRILAVVSLASWVLVLLAGRAIAYL